MGERIIYVHYTCIQIHICTLCMYIIHVYNAKNLFVIATQIFCSLVSGTTNYFCLKIICILKQNTNAFFALAKYAARIS